LIYLCDTLFTEINAAAAAACVRFPIRLL